MIIKLQVENQRWWNFRLCLVQLHRWKVDLEKWGGTNTEENPSEGCETPWYPWAPAGRCTCGECLWLISLQVYLPHCNLPLWAAEELWGREAPLPHCKMGERSPGSFRRGSCADHSKSRREVFQQDFTLPAFTMITLTSKDLASCQRPFPL